MSRLKRPLPEYALTCGDDVEHKLPMSQNIDGDHDKIDLTARQQAAMIVEPKLRTG